MVHTVTSAQTSPADDQAQRIRRYLTMMGIRVACFILMVVITPFGLVFVLHGWLRWVAIIGAVVLPYFAVVTANAVRPSQSGTIQPVTPQADRNRLEQ